MKKHWLFAGLVLVLAVAGLAGCSNGAPSLNGEQVKISLASQQEGIWVNGTGKVSAVPDIAYLQLGVEAQAMTVSEARDQAAGAMEQVIQALKDNGIEEKDIQTQYFSINRVTRWDNTRQEEIFMGFRVNNTVTAKIRNIENSGAVIDAVATAGGDLTRINSIGFSIDDPKQYQEQARADAVADAAAKAKQLADAAGVKLSKPLYITENTYIPGPIFRQDLAVKEAAGVPAPETPISPGEMEISVNVQIAYGME